MVMTTLNAGGISPRGISEADMAMVKVKLVRAMYYPVNGKNVPHAAGSIIEVKEGDAKAYVYSGRATYVRDEPKQAEPKQAETMAAKAGAK